LFEKTHFLLHVKNILTVSCMYISFDR
jgi:hypothetical protein